MGEFSIFEGGRLDFASLHSPLSSKVSYALLLNHEA